MRDLFRRLAERTHVPLGRLGPALSVEQQADAKRRLAGGGKCQVSRPHLSRQSHNHCPAGGLCMTREARHCSRAASNRMRYLWYAVSVALGQFRHAISERTWTSTAMPAKSFAVPK
jgi:hypothetical protein